MANEIQEPIRRMLNFVFELRFGAISPELRDRLAQAAEADLHRWLVGAISAVRPEDVFEA